MVFSKTDTADIEVSYDEAKFNFPHNRSGYRKFLQFIPAKFSNLIRWKTMAGWMHLRHIYFVWKFDSSLCSRCNKVLISTLYSFIVWLKLFKGFLVWSRQTIFPLIQSTVQTFNGENKKNTFINPTFYSYFINLI